MKGAWNALIERSDGHFLCAGSGFQSVHEIESDGQYILNLKIKRAAPAKIQQIALGRPGGQEVLFACLQDNTVRAFIIEEKALVEIAQLKEPIKVQQLLWDPFREVLYFGEECENRKMRVRTVSWSGEVQKSLKVEGVLVEPEMNLDICGWGVAGEKSLYCFERNTQSIIELKLID